MKLTLSNAPANEEKVEALIVLILEKKPLLRASRKTARHDPLKLVRDWMAHRGFSGKLNATCVFPTPSGSPARHLLLAGMGERRHFTIQRLEQALASAARQARSLRLTTLALSLDASARGLGLSPARFAAVAATAFENSLYDLPPPAPGGPRNGRLRSVVLADTQRPGLAALRRACERGRIIGRTLREIRALADLPANQATPEHIATRVRSLARKLGLRCTVWGHKELVRQRCHALLTVAQGSRHQARLVILAYPGRPPRSKARRPILLLGKTITFDAGGISLKPPKNMEWMKYDKCGGMAVLATMAILARLRLPQPVVGILAIAENMPGGSAVRPGDVIGSRAGLHIEIVNTDAEGRLVLADALSVAGRYRPSAIVDVATLTGAVVVALGSDLTGLMGNDEKLLRQLERAGDASGDPAWRLPLLPSFREGLSSPFADLKNVGGNGAGSSVGGAFLQAFVPEGVPWAHLDIAGTAWKESGQPYGPAGATLSGTRLLIEWIMSLSV